MKELKAETWGQELKQGPWRAAAFWLVFYGPQPAFLQNPSPPSQGWCHSQ